MSIRYGLTKIKVKRLFMVIQGIYIYSIKTRKKKIFVRMVRITIIIVIIIWIK